MRVILPKSQLMLTPRGALSKDQMMIRDVSITVKGGTYQGRVFQSYDHTIGFRSYGDSPMVVLDQAYWDYSTTTGRYRNAFLNEGIAETRAKIESGEYILADLN